MVCRRWRELSTTDFATIARDKAVIVLPTGSMEQHGPHMPVGTDSLLNEAIQEGVMARLKDVDCLFLPTLWCTKSNEHADYPGTVWLSMQTLVQVLKEIAASVARAGFRRLVFMNSHGGNTELLAPVIRDVRQETGLLTFILELPRFYIAPPCTPGAQTVFDIHAGYAETSMLLACYPRLMEDRQWAGLGSDTTKGRVAESFAGFRYIRPDGRPVAVAWLTPDYTHDGVVGDPTQANPADGQLGLDRVVSTVCDILREIARFDYRS